jgi:hypothetical protein
MAKRPTFQRNPVPTPPPANPSEEVKPAVSEQLGNRPLPKNKIVQSDNTEKQLKMLGWEDGDPIPPELGQRVKQIMDAREKAESHNLPADFKPKQGRVVDFSELSEAERQELSDVLKDYKQQMVAQAEYDASGRNIEKKLPGADPSVVAAAKQAQAAAETPAMPEVKIIPPKPVEEAAPTPEPEPEPISEPVMEEDEDYDNGLDTNPVHCPRCLWRTDIPFTAEPTERDRQVFMASLLGTNRFTKTYDIMGGNMKVSFRSLLSKEVDLVFKQLNCDATNGVITGDGDFFLRMEQYRTLCSVSRIADASNTPQIEIAPLFELDWPGDDSGKVENTRLKDLADWFNEEISNESLRRVLYQHYREFQRLVEAMEAQTAEPNFWKGIGQPA